MNKSKAFCVGLFQGDGCLGLNINRRNTSKGLKEYKYWYVTYGSTDKYLTDYFGKEFNINKTLKSEDKRKDTYKDYYRVHTHNKDVTSFFLSLGYLERKSIDLGKLFNLIEGYEWEFLQGLLESDGYVTKDSYVEWVTDNYNLAIKIQDFLVKEGFDARLYSQSRKNSILYTVRIFDITNLYEKLYRFKPDFISRKHKRLLDIKYKV